MPSPGTTWRWCATAAGAISCQRQTLIGLLDWDLSAQAAVDLSRVANLNGATELEEGTPIADQADALRKLGHEVQVRRHEGDAGGRRGPGGEAGEDGHLLGAT